MESQILVQVSAPQKSVKALEGWIEFFSKKGIATKVEIDKSGIIDMFTLWRGLTSVEEKELSAGKCTIHGDMLVYTKNTKKGGRLNG